MTNEKRLRVALDALALALAGAQSIANLEAMPEEVRPLLKDVGKVGLQALTDIERLMDELEEMRARGGVQAEDLEALNERVDAQEEALLENIAEDPAEEAEEPVEVV